jgi:hypothetical protein
MGAATVLEMEAATPPIKKFVSQSEEPWVVDLEAVMIRRAVL